MRFYFQSFKLNFNSLQTPSALGEFVFDDIYDAIYNRDLTVISELGPAVTEFEKRGFPLCDPNNEEPIRRGLALYYAERPGERPRQRQTFENQNEFLTATPNLKAMMVRAALQENAMVEELKRPLHSDEHASGMGFLSSCFCYSALNRATIPNEDYMNRIGITPSYVGRRNIINPLIVQYLAHSHRIYLSTDGTPMEQYVRTPKFRAIYEGYDIDSLLDLSDERMKRKSRNLVCITTPFKVNLGDTTFSYPGSIYAQRTEKAPLVTVWGQRGQEATEKLNLEHNKEDTFIFQTNGPYFNMFRKHVTAAEFLDAERFVRANPDTATIAVQFRNDRGVTLVSGYELYGCFIKKRVFVMVVEQKNIFSKGKVTFFLK